MFMFLNFFLSNLPQNMQPIWKLKTDTVVFFELSEKTKTIFYNTPQLRG